MLKQTLLSKKNANKARKCKENRKVCNKEIATKKLLIIVKLDQIMKINTKIITTRLEKNKND